MSHQKEIKHRFHFLYNITCHDIYNDKTQNAPLHAKHEHSQQVQEKMLSQMTHTMNHCVQFHLIINIQQSGGKL